MQMFENFLFFGVLSIKIASGKSLILICFDLIGKIASALKPDVASGLFHAQVTAQCVLQLKYNPRT